MKYRTKLVICLLASFLMLMIPSIPAMQYKIVQNEVQTTINTHYKEESKIGTDKQIINQNLLKNNLKSINLLKNFYLLILILSIFETIFGIIMVIISLTKGDVDLVANYMAGTIIWLIDVILYYKLYMREIESP